MNDVLTPPLIQKLTPKQLCEAFAPARPKRLTFLGPIDGLTGYGMHATQIVRDITRLANCHVSIRAVKVWEAWGAKVPDDIRALMVSGPQPEPWELLLHPPNFMPTPGKKVAYFTMWEATALPPMGAHVLNKAEVVIVPCHWNASCFSACGVKRPIEVVPLGINQDIFNARNFPSNFPEILTFGAAGRMAHGGVRKGINEVIEIFGKAFPKKVKDVRLKVKCFPDCPVSKIKDPRIEVTQAYLTEAQLADWFASLNCFISAARSEGWGLMQHQAMNVGRPVVSVKFGGITEFFDERAGYALPFNIAPAKFAYANCGHWAEPNEEAFIETLRWIYEHRSDLPVRGALAIEKTAPFSWQNSNLKLLAVLDKFGAL